MVKLFKSFLENHYLRFIIVFQILLFIPHIPQWTIISGIILWILSFFNFYKKFKYLNAITGIASVILTAFCLIQFNYILSNEMISSLLLLLTTIRLIEYNHKDLATKPPYFIYLLGIFLALTKFIFEIDFIFGVYSFFFILFYLFQFYPPNIRSLYQRQLIKTHLIITIKAIPLTILIFIIFPRLQFKSDGQVDKSFGLYSDIATTGFSADLAPGSISEVVEQNEIAFRAKFFDKNPPSENLYWKGQVLDRPLGFFWKRSNSELTNSDELTSEHFFSNPSYKIILEPHSKEQIFTLYSTDLVNSEFEKVSYSPKNDTFSLNSILNNQIVYYGFIDPFKKNKFNSIYSELYLKLNRREAAIESLLSGLESEYRSASSIKSDIALTPEEKVAIIGRYFLKGRFTYSLNNKNNLSASLSAFLLATKIGFCEHYASASALLLRYWNVPSRVIVGYQGGEFNSSGQFWTIKQRDAHAWVEYIDSKNNWTLFDPIINVAPERIKLGSKTFYSNLKNNTIQNLLNNLEFYNYFLVGLENFNYQWTLFFAEFSNFKIKKLFETLYTENEEVQLVLNLILFLLIIWLIYKRLYKFIYQSTPLSDRFKIEFEKFIKTCVLKNIKQSKHAYKNESLTVTQINELLVQRFPYNKIEVETLMNIYLQNRFSPGTNFKEFKRFKNLIKILKLNA